MIEKTEAQKRTESLLLAGLKSRRAKEKRFVWLGRGAIAIALFFLATLFILLAQRVFRVFSNIMSRWKYRWIAPGLIRQAIYPTSPFLMARQKSWSMKLSMQS